VLDSLAIAGYDRRNHRAFLQCFDAQELWRIRHELGSDLKLVQLIGENDWHESATDFDALRTHPGLGTLAGTVDAVGPWLQQLYDRHGGDAAPVPSELTAAAHAHGLAVHPYTFRIDDLPDGFGDFASLVRFFVDVLRVDGLFTDFPDRVRSLILP
jgi:glycerophosphoryl diester phosphodiesterase